MKHPIFFVGSMVVAVVVALWLLVPSWAPETTCLDTVYPMSIAASCHHPDHELHVDAENKIVICRCPEGLSQENP